MDFDHGGRKTTAYVGISETALSATESVDRYAVARCREHSGTCGHIIPDSSAFPSQPQRRDSSRRIGDFAKCDVNPFSTSRRVLLHVAGKIRQKSKCSLG